MFFNKHSTISIVIQIPALDRMIDYIIEKDTVQLKVDAASTVIAQLTQRLAETTSALQDALTNNQQNNRT